MSNNYFQTIIDLIFPKDRVDLDSAQSFGDKSVEDLGITVWVATEYNNSAIHDLINRIKVEDQFSYSADLCCFFVERVKDCFNYNKKVLIVPVPADPKRFLKDGFALSTILAKKLSSSLNLDYTQLLHKNENTIKQSYLSREERLDNLKDKITLYEAKTNVANYDEAWIIDDITTTGATLAECQKVIQKNYPFVEVKLLALASN